MTINISIQDVVDNLHPKITVLGVGGSGGNAVNNMINANLEGVDFLIANTDAQALQISKCPNKIQLGLNSTKGLGAGMRPDIGKQAAEEAIQDLSEKFDGSHMLFIAAGMGGGTGTGAAPVIAKLAREKGILTVGVVTKPFHFEGSQRMKLADKGIEELQQYVDTLLTIPNQNLFRIANEKTTFSDAFKMADDVLYAGVRGVTDLMVQPGMINLDFSDIKTVMSEMGKAMMGTGEASGEARAIAAAEAAIANPLIDDVSLKGAKGLIINITGGKDITLYEVDEAANRIKQEVDEEANIIYGTTCDERLEGLVRVSIVATGIDANINKLAKPIENFAPININNEIYKNDNVETNEQNNDQVNSIASNYEDKLIDTTSEKDKNFIEENINMDHVNINEQKTEDLDTELISENDHQDVVENISIETNDILEEKTNEILEEETNDILEEDLKHDHALKDEENNTTNEASVRRLSLFDTLTTESTETPADNINLTEKTEPILSPSEEVLDTSKSEDLPIKDELINEFDAEEKHSIDADNEFNHYASAVKVENDWYYFDSNLEPEYDRYSSDIYNEILAGESARLSKLYPKYKWVEIKEGMIYNSNRNVFPAKNGLLIQQIAPLNQPLPVITLDADLEQMLIKMARQSGEEGLVLDNELAQKLLTKIAETTQKLSNEGKTAALVVSPAIRRQFSAIVRQHVEEMIVLAFTELPDNRKINVVASIAG
mgnify:CR=1 FL=1